MWSYLTLTLRLPPPAVRTFILGNLRYLKVGVNGVRGKLEYVAAVELYLLVCLHARREVGDAGVEVGRMMGGDREDGAERAEGVEVGNWEGDEREAGRRVLTDLRGLASVMVDRPVEADTGSGNCSASGSGIDSERGSTSRHLELQRRLAAVHRNISAAILQQQVGAVVAPLLGRLPVLLISRY